jgi:toxin ParE1/3/4
MAKVIWSDAAATDIEQIVDYIEARDADAAARIGATLFALGESLKDYPNRGRPVGNVKRELASVAPDVLRYRVAGDSVFILPVRHERQRLLTR